MYKYGIIDANYLINRIKAQQSRDEWVYSNDNVNFYWDKELTNPCRDMNYYVRLESDGQEDGVPYYKLKTYLNESLMAKSFIQSVMKLKRDFPHEYSILCWDKSPYYKTETIKEYKQDRYRPTEDEVTDLKSKLRDSNISDQDKVTIRNSIQEMEIDMTNFKTMQNVKYYLIFDLNDCGWNSCIKSGFEADDLAHLISDIYRDNHTDQKSVLLTTDKDWLHFTNEWVDFISIKYPNKDYSYITDPATEAMDKYNIPRYDYGILSEIYGGSHNNVSGLGELEWDEFLDRYWVKHDDTMPKYTEVDAYYNAMQIDKHKDEVSSLLNHAMNNWKVVNGKMKQFCKSNSINLNLNTYGQFINNLPLVDSNEPIIMKSLIYGGLDNAS